MFGSRTLIVFSYSETGMLQFTQKGICLDKIKKPPWKLFTKKKSLNYNWPLTRSLRISFFALIEYSAPKSDNLQAITLPVGFPVGLATSYVQFAEEKRMLLFVSLSERTFSQEKTVQDEARIGYRNKHWTAENGMKIRFYF